MASRRDIAFLAASSLRVENSLYGIALAVIAKRGCDKAHYYLDERANTRPLLRTKAKRGIGFYARTFISASRCPWPLIDLRDRRRGGERLNSKMRINLLWKIYDAI